MAKIKERRLALELRKQGKSYSQLKKRLGLSKSTLSLWLRNYPLSKEQIDALRGKNPARIEKFRNTMQRKREKRLHGYYIEEKNYWLPLSQRELYLAGLFLYWGEGGKNLQGQIALNNTDPQVVKFTLYWLVNILKVPKDRIRVYLHLYSDMDIQMAIAFWRSELNLPMSQFTKPYIKQSKRLTVDHKGFGHGTCGIFVSDVRLKEKIMMAIKAISNSYSLMK